MQEGASLALALFFWNPHNSFDNWRSGRSQGNRRVFLCPAQLSADAFFRDLFSQLEPQSQMGV
jgi:hypothetical protein